MSEEERAVMKALADVVRNMEWLAGDDDWLEETCPYCDNTKSEGHDGCSLADALARYDALSPTPPPTAQEGREGL